MTSNFTINHQLEHRTIRKFKDQTLTADQLQTLYRVASQTSTSMFMQQASIMHITDDNLRAKIRQISGQPYVGANGDLFIFIVDLYRNQQIRHHNGFDDGRLHTTDIFFQGMEDTVLMLQNMAIAAESMGLGVTILGSINDHPAELVKVLQLPKLTFPVLGLQVGVPDQKPQLKPRLPLEMMSFENQYATQVNFEQLAKYDQIVTNYYDLRDTSKRIDSFTNQIDGQKLAKRSIDRDQIVQVLHDQELCLDFK
ncbi:NADPH-dependent oxidoreductase [Limosilactobacillus caecicola]|uniref:NADPH-dependent oxidoreductase n=1 Tax=Limosilactobacillus caecicola TaxID=2941332 RepID=UPI00203DB823|nr:NADPH-dependent oxidoreductase [Limosilactobacillus caecicola]